MQNFLFGLDGYVADVLVIILDAYSLRAIPLLSPVSPVWIDVFPYSLNWRMMTDIRRVFSH